MMVAEQKTPPDQEEQRERLDYDFGSSRQQDERMDAVALRRQRRAAARQTWGPARERRARARVAVDVEYLLQPGGESADLDEVRASLSGQMTTRDGTPTDGVDESLPALGLSLRDYFCRHLDRQAGHGRAAQEARSEALRAAWTRLGEESPDWAWAIEQRLGQGRRVGEVAAERGVTERTVQYWVRYGIGALAEWVREAAKDADTPRPA